MMRPSLAASLGLLFCFAPPGAQATPRPDSPAAWQEARRLAQLPPVAPEQLDHSGRKQQGRVSYYATGFTNRRMANGARFDPNSYAAASKTLPLGTTARVTNLQNGKSATVKVEDRGPHVAGRVMDVTPKVAAQLDIKGSGVARVMVAPIAVPQPDGGVKLGAGAAETSRQELAAILGSH